MNAHKKIVLFSDQAEWGIWLLAYGYMTLWAMVYEHLFNIFVADEITISASVATYARNRGPLFSQNKKQ